MSMTQQYRHELCALAQAERATLRDQQRHDRSCERQIKLLIRDRDRRHQSDDAALTRIHKRRAILEGRLAQ